MRSTLLRDGCRAVTGQAGFTLLELLVVLVVLGMAASLAGPKLWHSYEKAQEQSVVRGYGEAILGLRLKAFHAGQAVTLSAANNEGRNIQDAMLPDDWSIERFDTLFLLPSGVTNGGSVILTAPTARRWQLIFRPLDGHMEVTRL